MRFGVDFEPAAWRLVDADTAAAASVANEVGESAVVRIAADTAGVWVATGGSSVAATAGTANELLVPAGTVECIRVPLGDTYVALIHAAASAKWSLSVLDS